MKRSLKRMQPTMAFAASHLDEDLSLAALAARAGLSSFHLHRLFSESAGETPRQFTLRLRLARASVMLLAGADSILNVALACGFQSHEAFCRVFRRLFGTTPSAYRQRGHASGATAAQAARHADLVHRVGLCLRLFQSDEGRKEKGSDMAYSVTRIELSPQPALVVRRRVKRSEIATALGNSFGQVFQYAQRIGATLAGPPFTRFLEWGPGVLTILAGMPVAVSVPGEGDIVPDTLPGGPAATTTHAGPYENLGDAHAAVQVWIEEEGFVAAGPPWESYITDPADYPDPADWKTEIFWPVAALPPV